MGLLDDAIREHLELKRRRGADPDEVARQENEALGDPRAPEAAVVPEGVPAEAGPVAEPVAPEPAPEAPVDADPDVAAVAAPAPEPPVAPEPAPAAAPAEPEPEPWLEDDPPAAVAAPRDPEPAPEPPRADPPPAGGTDEDVLEETPDFLQETPEHDRLWFEQKPPRDFDFDR